MLLDREQASAPRNSPVAWWREKRFVKCRVSHAQSRVVGFACMEFKGGHLSENQTSLGILNPVFVCRLLLQSRKQSIVYTNIARFDCILHKCIIAICLIVD